MIHRYMPNQLLEPEALFHALGDPTRMAVVKQLCHGPGSVSDLAAPYRMALPSFLQHLGVLEKSGWVQSQKVGRVRTFRMNRQALAMASSWLDRQRKAWDQRLGQLDGYVKTMED
jgi:DNA-binding transcriptional ArsR family regulator